MAAILHGVPRATLDCEILIEASPENARRTFLALEQAGMGTATMISAEALLATEVTVLKDVARLDVQTRTPGLDFAGAWERREARDYDGQRFFIVSKSDLIASKKAAGRKIDLEDVRLLNPAND